MSLLWHLRRSFQSLQQQTVLLVWPAEEWDATHFISISDCKESLKKTNTEETDLNQGQEQLGEVSRSVACYVFIQLLLEHYERRQTRLN